VASVIGYYPTKAMFKIEWRNLRIRMTAWYVLLLFAMLFLFGAYLYFRLESSLLSQTDESLTIAGSQALGYADDDAPAPHFIDSEDYRHAARHLMQAGFSTRLLDANGVFTQGFGRQNGPPWPVRPDKGWVTRKADEVKYHGEAWRFYSQRIEDKQGNLRGWIETGKPLSFVQDALSSLYLNILIAIPALVLVAGLGGVFLARRALAPIDDVNRTAESITATDFSQRIRHAGPRGVACHRYVIFCKELLSKEIGYWMWWKDSNHGSASSGPRRVCDQDRNVGGLIWIHVDGGGVYFGGSESGRECGDTRSVEAI
jgi:HAMP domain-containing protein